MAVESSPLCLTPKSLLFLGRSEKWGWSKCRWLVGGEGHCARATSWKSRAEEVSGERGWIAVLGKGQHGGRDEVGVWAREGGGGTWGAEAVGPLPSRPGPKGHSWGWAAHCQPHPVLSCQRFFYPNGAGTVSGGEEPLELKR